MSGRAREQLEEVIRIKIPWRLDLEHGGGACASWESGERSAEERVSQSLTDWGLALGESTTYCTTIYMHLKGTGKRSGFIGA